MFIFLTYLPMVLLKFWPGEIVGCGIKFQIQRVPTQHTFDGPCYPKNKKYLKNVMMTSSSHFFQVFLVFWVAVPIKSMPSGYSLDAKFNSASNNSPNQNLSKKTGRYVKNTNKKVVFSFLPPKLINITLLFELLFY